MKGGRAHSQCVLDCKITFISTFQVVVHEKDQVCVCRFAWSVSVELDTVQVVFVSDTLPLAGEIKLLLHGI